MRGLNQSFATSNRPGVLATAVRIAVVLNEGQGLDALGPLTPPEFAKSSWMCDLTVLMMLMICLTFLKGCDPADESENQTLAMFVYNVLAWMLDNPVTAFR